MSPKGEAIVTFLAERSAYKPALMGNLPPLTADHSIFRRLYSDTPSTEEIHPFVIQTPGHSLGIRSHTE